MIFFSKSKNTEQTLLSNGEFVTALYFISKNNTLRSVKANLMVDAFYRAN